MPPLAVRVESLGKRYHLGAAPGHHRASELLAHAGRQLAALPARLVSRPPAAPVGDHPDDFWALRDVSFDVRQGEAVGIVGRNGSGKSTLLKILSRITEQTTGRFGLRGRIGSLLEVGTGFHPDLSGRENVYLNGVILGMTRAEVRRKFDAIVDFAETAEFLDTPVKRYSSGMYVRLAFAIAAHFEPEVLILDEVLAVGDAAFQRKCLAKMEEIRNRGGCTTLVVNHDLPALRSLCPRAVWLDRGRVVGDGPSADVIGRYEAKHGGRTALAPDAGSGGAELEPTPATLPLDGTFTAELASHFVVRSGAWRAGPGRLQAIPRDDGTLAVATLLLAGPPPADLDVRVTPGVRGAFVLFDVESATRFRFAGQQANDGAWVVGRCDGREWTVEAAADDDAAAPNIGVRLRGGTATVTSGGVVKLVHDLGGRAVGGIGLGAAAAVRFESLSVRPPAGLQHPPTFSPPEPP